MKPDPGQEFKPAHAERLGQQLFALDNAEFPQDMNVPGWKLHRLRGYDDPEHWAITVNANWRMTFAFEGRHAILIDYQDYH